MKRLILALVTLVVFPTCSDTIVSSSADLPQIVASAEYINFAFEYHHFATYIDKHGRVYDVTYSESDAIWELLDTVTVYTPDIFAKLLADTDPLGYSVDSSTFIWMLQSSNRVAKGNWQGCMNSGSDMGTWLTSVYISTGRNKAKRIKLAQWGDFTCFNDDSLAAPLSDTILNYQPSHLDHD